MLSGRAVGLDCGVGIGLDGARTCFGSHVSCCIFYSLVGSSVDNCVVVLGVNGYAHAMHHVWTISIVSCPA